MSIRRGVADDLSELTGIYNHYVRETPTTFDLAPFEIEARRPWFEAFAATGRHQLFVAEREGRVLGYACSHGFRAKGAYDSSVETFRPELQRFEDKTRKAALGFIEGIYAGGSTNIDGALRATLTQLQDSSRPNYVLFLTDGLPTAGETNELKIKKDRSDARDEIQKERDHPEYQGEVEA